MKLQIFDQVTIQELNSILQLQFPFVKLVFFQNPDNNRNYCQSCRVSDYKQLGEVSPQMNEGILEVSGSEIVWKLEKSIYSQFGLSTRVYHRYNQSWTSAELASEITIDMVNSLGEQSHGAIENLSLL